MDSGNALWDLSKLSATKQLEIADKHGVVHAVSRGVGIAMPGKCFVCSRDGSTADLITEPVPPEIQEKLIEWYPGATQSWMRNDERYPRVRFRACENHAPILKTMHECINRHKMQIAAGGGSRGKRMLDMSMCVLVRSEVDSLIAESTRGEQADCVS